MRELWFHLSLEDRKNVIENLWEKSILAMTNIFQQSCCHCLQVIIVLDLLELIFIGILIFSCFEELCGILIDDLKQAVDELGGWIEVILIIFIVEEKSLE